MTNHPLKQITFLKDWRCYKAGQQIQFEAGLNMLVGDQGSGKSSLLTLLRSMAGAKGLDWQAIIKPKVSKVQVFSFDFEKENPRIKGELLDNVDTGVQLALRLSSHGEAAKAIMKAIVTEGKRGLFLIDEPDMALSPRSVVELRKTLLGLAVHSQVIVSAHNPILILGSGVLSLEHKRWMPGKEYLRLHGWEAK